MEEQGWSLGEGMLPGKTESYEHSSNQHDPIINIHRAQTKHFMLELLINQREKGGKGRGEEKREDRKEGMAGGRGDGKGGLGSFRVTSAHSELEPPVRLLNCAINLCGRQGRLYLIQTFTFSLFLQKGAG